MRVRPRRATAARRHRRLAQSLSSSPQLAHRTAVQRRAAAAAAATAAAAAAFVAAVDGANEREVVARAVKRVLGARRACAAAEGVGGGVEVGERERDWSQAAERRRAEQRLGVRGLDRECRNPPPKRREAHARRRAGRRRAAGGAKQCAKCDELRLGRLGRVGGGRLQQLAEQLHGGARVSRAEQSRPQRDGREAAAEDLGCRRGGEGYGLDLTVQVDATARPHAPCAAGALLGGGGRDAAGDEVRYACALVARHRPARGTEPG